MLGHLFLIQRFCCDTSDTNILLGHAQHIYYPVWAGNWNLILIVHQQIAYILIAILSSLSSLSFCLSPLLYFNLFLFRVSFLFFFVNCFLFLSFSLSFLLSFSISLYISLALSFVLYLFLTFFLVFFLSFSFSFSFVLSVFLAFFFYLFLPPQWGTADWN